jgi:RNA polymerase sigma factor (sigma-70 family)
MSECRHKVRTAQAVRQAMVQHDGLVHASIQRRGGGDITYEGALQAGRIGLWHAIRGYDPARGTAFSTYAWVAIRRQIDRRGQELSRDIDVCLPEMPATNVMPDLAEELDRELTTRALHDLVGQLPKRLRRVIVGRYGLGKHPPCTIVYTSRWKLAMERTPCKLRVPTPNYKEAAPWLRYPKVVRMSTPDTC